MLINSLICLSVFGLDKNKALSSTVCEWKERGIGGGGGLLMARIQVIQYSVYVEEEEVVYLWRQCKTSSYAERAGRGWAHVCSVWLVVAFTMAWIQVIQHSVSVGVCL